jgi:hypothetical protein
MEPKKSPFFTCPGSTSYLSISNPYLSSLTGSSTTLSTEALSLELEQLAITNSTIANIMFLIPDTFLKTHCGCKDKPHFLNVDKIVEKSGRFCKKM